MGNTNPVNSSYRGYSGGEYLFPPDQETRHGSPDITNLYKDYMASRSLGWPIAKRALQLAVKFFDPAKGFDFKKQDNNPLVANYNYRFLIDTLRFIATGRREMDIIMWGELMSDLPSPSDDVDQRHVLRDVISEYDIDLRPISLVKHWCSHKGGLHDMVISLNLLFGDRIVRRISDGASDQEPLRA